MARNTTTRPMRYGTTALDIFSSGRFVMPDATNRLMATGGVIMPMAMPTTNRMPKCSVEIFSARTSGRKTGVRMMIAEEVSMNTPATRMMREIRNRMTYLFVEMLNTAAEIASGIFQFASAQPNGPLHAMMIMMTALVLAEPSIVL